MVAGGTLVAALGTILGSHAGLGHDEDVGHVLATLVVGGFVADLFHGGESRVNVSEALVLFGSEDGRKEK